jgi:hypothetical protein
VKNEAPYLPEWIEYHLLVGVQKFWIVNNNSTDNTTEVLLPYVALGIVNLTLRPGLNQQIPAYNCIIPALRHICYWIALIDADEFLVPVKSHSVLDVLRKLEGAPGVTLNWVMFGSNGKEKKEPGLVIERFRSHVSWDQKINLYLKSIVNPRLVQEAICHEHVYLYKLQSRNARGLWKNPTLPEKPLVYDEMRLHHYSTKSYEEFYQKRVRGVAIDNTPEGTVHLISTVREQLSCYQDVVNDSMMEWAVPLVKANIVTRSNEDYRSTKQFSIESGSCGHTVRMLSDR